MKKKIEKLNINLFPEESTGKKKYEEERTKYIANCEIFQPGHSLGFWGGYANSCYVKSPAVGEANWNELYPLGYDSWVVKQLSLTGRGEQNVIDKLNEVIDFLNKKK